jgi:hypothetical protein
MKFAALVKTSTYVEGDERSRTHPGHGYPAHTVEGLEIVKFRDQAEMEAWIQKETTSYSKRSFELIRYETLTYTSTTTVKVSP